MHKNSDNLGNNGIELTTCPQQQQQQPCSNLPPTTPNNINNPHHHHNVIHNNNNTGSHHHHHHHHHHGPPETTAWDAWIQLTKAYIGPGCLSLPWAISQLGLPIGTIVICIVAFWTSYNCWNVVHLKRIIMKERRHLSLTTTADSDAHVTSNQQPHQQQVTYPDVGEWAYNRKFKDLLLISICVQQLAVCTVFLSFIGENIAAVMERTIVNIEEGDKPPSHALVITMALPFAMLLSCLPNLKVLSPVMVVATISLFVGFGLLGVVIEKEWDNRPQQQQQQAAASADNNLFNIEWSQVPMAVCAILYSYEGICVILPVESAMAQPKYFKTVFVTSMTFTAVVFATVACLCVVAFGDVTNGSVTAFLVENLEDEQVKWWLYMTNTACSLAVLLTYPLQLFPSFELIGPWMTRILRLDIGTHSMTTTMTTTTTNSAAAAASRRRLGRPAPPNHQSFSPVAVENPDDRIVGNHDYHEPTTLRPGSATTTSTMEEDEAGTDDLELIATNQLPFMAAFTTPGDSPQLRAILVTFTYIMAIAVPNVQLLVSLAGALSGSATGLIVPPLLELAYVKRQEATIRNSTITAASREDEEVCDDDDDLDPMRTATPPPPASLGSTTLRSPFILRMKKLECYVLFCSGVVVCVFGTGAALLDIAEVYLGT